MAGADGADAGTAEEDERNATKRKEIMKAASAAFSFKGLNAAP
jgi:hypothetical protein